jgi:GNAT superfamily N-acetyltransferase
MCSVSEVTTWYLESTSAAELIPAKDPGNLEIVEARIKQFAFNRFLYQWIGESWQWLDKLSWSDQQWRDYAESDSLRTWVAWCEGSPAGYFELQKQAGGDVEICYFGLAPGFIGKRMGGYLLSECIRQAWAWDAKRVRVNTCSLDHPGALANYQARGLRIYKTETEDEGN